MWKYGENGSGVSGGLKVNFHRQCKTRKARKLRSNTILHTELVNEKCHFPKNRKAFDIMISEVDDMFNRYCTPLKPPYRKAIEQQAFNDYSSIGKA